MIILRILLIVVVSLLTTAIVLAGTFALYCLHEPTPQDDIQNKEKKETIKNTEK